MISNIPGNKIIKGPGRLPRRSPPGGKWALPVMQLSLSIIVVSGDPGSTSGISSVSEQAKARLARPLRYHPEGTDFVIENGKEFFNRPLYSGNSAFRVDGGDKPEFSLYMPGRGGNLRLGIKTDGGTKWLNDADKVIARYRPGSLLYEIRDSLLADRVLHLAFLPMSGVKGLIGELELQGTGHELEIAAAFGGANGMRGSRGGDIGCEREPVSQFFQLRPEQCRGNSFSLSSNTFTLRSKVGTLSGTMPLGAVLATADARDWERPDELLRASNPSTELPVIVTRFQINPGKAIYLALQPNAEGTRIYAVDELPKVFREAEEHRREVAERVVVETPDPFINAAASALCVAADGIWDEQQDLFMHGAVAWRTKFLGWRGPYSGDALGWHERTAKHLKYYAARQNTEPIPESLPTADPLVNLTRNEAALHSNGDMTHSHYDMNLVGIDAMFRHLLWTGDLEFARAMWPAIERHLAWERRLFRRPFGPERLPLYEAYCCIWASDNMQYDGGGVAYSTAYNYYHNRMADRVARLLGKDPGLYEQEADLIEKAMQRELWLPGRGSFAECKDYLGMQLQHTNAGLWTLYHTVDSEVPNPFEAWQMTRYVDTAIPHIPVYGPRVPSGNWFTLPTSSWMPYMWSLNNVVMAEVVHTSLAYWQAGRAESAMSLFKGCILDSMYLGLCPGNVGMCTWYDEARGESQRDFGDGIGATSRALVEGLFGVRPDALAGELTIEPGFPNDWDHASLKHPDLDSSFSRQGTVETYTVQQRFSKVMKTRLRVRALRDRIEKVSVNGRKVDWRNVENSVGEPRIEVFCPPATNTEIVITWRGARPERLPAEQVVLSNSEFKISLERARALQIFDPQKILGQVNLKANRITSRVTGLVGHHTAFAKVGQGVLSWWLPMVLEVRSIAEQSAAEKVEHSSHPTWAPVDLARVYNDSVTRIFQNQYLSPRSSFCSLQTPLQGLGGWSDYNIACEIDDTGLRRVAAQNGGIFKLEQGVPFKIPDGGTNVVFVSQWDNYPHEFEVPLTGKASRVYLLMAGSSGPMQSRLLNGEVIVTYDNGSTERLPLENPTTWWPIDQDYFIDGIAFQCEGPLPLRVDLKTGRVRRPDPGNMNFKLMKIPGGSATVLELPLDPERKLKSLTVRAVANEVVIGLMAVTLAR